jgi:hypothetical protein
VTREAPVAGCADHAFASACPLDEGAGLALEDYARALLRAASAFTVRAMGDSALVAGVHVCGLAQAATPAQWQDVEAFAREMAAKAGEGGLGWS